MGFFSGVRRKIKKLIPKEIRPFIPYAAALIPGGPFAAGGLGASLGGNQFLKAALARGLTDDEASIKDIARAGIFAAAPTALDTGIGALDSTQGIGKFLTTAGKGKDATSIAEKVSRFADPSGMDAVYAVGGAGAIDAGIKAAELDKEALEKYNRDLAAQGISDRADRRSAIRKIYENTGTWDMDEVDGMLDTYGYRTGGRVGYAMGDFVDTDQIVEDLGDMGTGIKKGILSIGESGGRRLDQIIDLILNLPGPIKSGKEIIEILVERYGVDPEIAQRKIINRMSDANEGFGPQGLDGTPDDGYRRNIGIDAGAEDYYGETPAMPENLGDMGGNMDDMSGNSILNRLRRGQQYEEEAMPEGVNPIPMPELIPFDPDNPRVRPIPMPGIIGEGDGRTMEERFPGQRYELMSGGRVGYNSGDLVDMEDVILASMKGKKKKDKDDLAATEDGKDSKDIPMKDVIKSAIFDSDKERDSDLEDNINMMSKSYKILYPEVKENRIRPLSFEDGGSVDDRLMERVKELQDEGLDFASALAQAMKEDMASGKAMGGIMDGIDVNMREQIDTPRGDMMIDENMEVADSSLMDAYEIYKFDMMEQGLEPMSLEEFRDQAMAEGKMASMEAGQEATLEEIYIELLDSGMNPEDAAIKAREIYNGMSSKSSSRRTMAAQGGLMNLGGREMDLRGGGFVPMGRAERADDVPARLSKNEFVMTADAVRAAGGGSVQKGADLMYDQMKQLEGQA